LAHLMDGLPVIAFAVTALVITSLVSRVREQAKSSGRQKERLDRLYQLSEQLLGLEPETAIGEKLLQPFHRLFGVTAISIFDADTAELRTLGDSQFDLPGKTRAAYIQGNNLRQTDPDVSVQCLRVRGRMLGAIGFEGLQDAGETVGSLTALTATFLERVNGFQRASAAAAAAETEAYRSALLDALAHEFKTPLATIMTAAGGLHEAGPLTDEQLEMAETVENEASRLGSLTSRLLRTARLDRDEIRPRMELVEIASLTAQIVAQYSARSPDRRVILNRSEGRAVMLADPELLRLILNQLIENACKYSQPGSTVTIEIEPLGDFIDVKVSNNGSSIPLNESKRIFERFYRGVEARRSTPGSGLGLHVARKIALAHGGTLDLEAGERVMDGVTFSLKLPATKDELTHVLAEQ
jgi:two-component system, OmpR family, sensor histidine kinase KdpD